MTLQQKTLLGTSGYSFPDWVGTFYPHGTPRERMFEYYIKHFPAVELNFTYYRLPDATTIDRLARQAPDDFAFWVKANQQTTHEQNRAVAREFIDNLQPMRQAGKLAGVLLQFPQSFHRTIANRQYLSAALTDLAGPPLAVEFRHRSWDAPAVDAGLRQRGATLVVPDAPAIGELYRPAPRLTGRTGYLRLHSRDAGKWYAGAAERYDYSYSPAELTEIADQWSALESSLDRLFVFFNNCHRGQAAQNAQAFRKVMDDLARR